MHIATPSHRDAYLFPLKSTEIREKTLSNDSPFLLDKTKQSTSTK